MKYEEEISNNHYYTTIINNIFMYKSHLKLQQIKSRIIPSLLVSYNIIFGFCIYLYIPPIYKFNCTMLYSLIII